MLYILDMQMLLKLVSNVMKCYYVYQMLFKFVVFVVWLRLGTFFFSLVCVCF